MKERMMRLRRLCAVTLSAALVLGGTETTYMVSAEEFSDTEVFADHSGVSPEEADDAEISTPDIEGENLSGGGGPGEF